MDDYSEYLRIKDNRMPKSQRKVLLIVPNISIPLYINYIYLIAQPSPSFHKVFYN